MTTNLMPCGLDDPRIRLEPDNNPQSVEDYADTLMAECVRLAGADAINKAHDLYDGILLPQMMQAVACWTGSSVSAAQQMRKLHNLLSDALQVIAERETK